MSDAVLERLIEEVVALRHRMAHLETLETPSPGIIVGMIVPFSGALAGENNHYAVDPATGLPDLNWHVCNGETVNGHQTPDLRDRFIIGAGGSYSPGATGGASSHQHTYTQVPSHTHTMQTAGSHTHTYRRQTGGTGGGSRGSGSTWLSYTGEDLPWAGDHSHTIDAAGVASPSTGTASSLPPYVALVWLMRVR